MRVSVVSKRETDFEVSRLVFNSPLMFGLVCLIMLTSKPFGVRLRYSFVTILFEFYSSFTRCFR